MSVDLVKYNALSNSGQEDNLAIIGGSGSINNLLQKKFIGNRDFLSPNTDPLFANEQELIDFLTKNNIKVCTADDKNGDSSINWLYMALAAAAGLLGGYFIFSK